MLETVAAIHDLAIADQDPAVPSIPEEAHRSSKKRKRENKSDSRLETFKIFPCPHSPFDRISTATGLFFIPRSGLSLSLLAQHRISNVLSTTRFFSATINSFDAPTQITDATNTNFENHVLIATLEGDQSLYAIEKVKDGIYSFCKLAPWVNTQHLRHSAKTIPQDTTQILNVRAGAEWWALAAAVTNEQLTKEPRRNIGLGSQNATSLLEPTPTIRGPSRMEPLPVESDERAKGLTGNPPALSSSEIAQQTPQNTLTNLVRQYLDALYMSKTSLAYFAKGPLSRSRAAFSAMGKLEELAAFLGSLVMSLSTADKKYKTVLPDLLKSFAIPADTQTFKTRKKRTLKPGKDGLFSDETNFVATWWRNDDQGLLVTNKDDFSLVLSRSISQLRFRETLLQLILILEALAIGAMIADEATMTAPTKVDCEGLDPAEEHKNVSIKSKKSHYLRSLLDTLVDRLTIWQSVDSASSAVEDATSKGHKQMDTPAVSNNEGDQLKDFCSQVVIPFYSSRLPTVVDGLNQKIGSTGRVSPARRAADSLKNTKAANIPPGTELLREKPSKSRSTNSRAWGEAPIATAGRTNPMESWKAESATEPNLGGRRRNLSRSQSISQPGDRSTTLSRTSSFSQSRERTRPLSRSNSVSQTNQTLKQREVDFSAIGKFYQAKIRKKLDVEQELKDAITALKKPNRDLAVKEYMEAAQERISSTKSQKPVNPGRRKRAMGVEINATPKRPDKPKCNVALTPSRANGQHTEISTQHAPITNLTIPGSALRQSPFGVTSSVRQRKSIVSSAPQPKGAPSSIFETPSRGNENTLWRLQASREASRRVAEINPVFQTPTKVSVSMLKDSTKTFEHQFPQCNNENDAIDTFRKGHAASSLAFKRNENLENNARPVTDENYESIYQSLGWDDADELA